VNPGGWLAVSPPLDYKPVLSAADFRFEAGTENRSAKKNQTDHQSSSLSVSEKKGASQEVSATEPSAIRSLNQVEIFIF